MPNRESRSFLRMGVLLALLATGGCYTFRPVEDVSLGVDVRARLNVEAAVRRSQGLDEPIQFVDGRVIERGPESMSLDVLVARSSSAFQDVMIRDTVTLMNSEVESLMERRFSVARTALLSVVTVGATVAVVSGISAIVGGNEDEDPNGGTQQMVVPMFSFGSHMSFRVLGISVR
jgi:hypothetical protein